MRSFDVFKGMIPEFGEAVSGKIGNDFMNAVIDFMRTHGFEQNVVNMVFEDDKCRVFFFTDNVLNHCGILFAEQFEEGAAMMAATRSDMATIIEEYKAKEAAKVLE